MLVQGGIGGLGVSGGCRPACLRPCVAIGPGHHVHGVERQLRVPGMWDIGKGKPAVDFGMYTKICVMLRRCCKVR